MHIYYVAGLPYSDELSHSGVKGMKWYQRRYQNEDGSLTPLGRIHYGVGKAASAVGKKAKAAGKAVGNTAKKVGGHTVQKFKDRHKWVMSDEELQKRIQRIDMEKKYKDLLRDTGPQRKGRKLIGDILTEGAKTLGRGAFNKFTNDLFKEKPDESSPSYQMLQTFKDSWNNEYMKPGGHKPNREELEEFEKYMKTLRSIEGGGKGGKKGGGG